MFKQFKSLTNTIYKNNQIAVDKYNVIIQVNWMLRNYRIELFNKDNEKYKILKKYWKLLSKSPIGEFTKNKKQN